MSGIINVPEVINNFNLYNTGNILVGVTGAVTLPDLNAITEEISGAGILGTYETTMPGFYSSLEQEIAFRALHEDMFSLMNPGELVDLTMRASEQSTVKSTGALDYRGMRVVERGRFKSFTPGKLELGKQMEAKLVMETLYIMIEIEGKTMLEYDKLNAVFVVDGKDLLEKVRAYS